MNEADIQTWPEIPTISHFCSLFREAFNLFEFDMEQLEESLLLLGSEEEGGLVTKLVMKLLQGCLPMYKKHIKQQNYSKYLVQLFQTKLEEAEEDKIQSRFENPFTAYEHKDFALLSLRDKVIVLHQLCEYRLEAPDVADKVKNLDAASLRVEPLGIDSEGSTLWYFYGTRLYKETSKDPVKIQKNLKRRRKNKKLKKRKRRKLSDESSEQSDDCEVESDWSVACLTQDDWTKITEKYKSSERKEDRRIYRILHESFLPEIAEMFKEKDKEDKRKEIESLAASKRSSSRIETLKKSQEEKDRLLAIQLAEEAEKEIGRGRRKRDQSDFRRLVENECREDRARQRELMKEMRAKRSAEKLVESRFEAEVQQQRSKLKQGSGKNRRPPTFYNDSSTESSGGEESGHSRDSSSESDNYEPPRKNCPVARASFSTALLRAGTKSTHDNTLEKSKLQNKDKEAEEKKPVVRKVAGQLLQTAGKGLLNLMNRDKVNDEDNLFKPASSCISFGLYGGHLSVDKDASGDHRLGLDETHRPFHLSILDQPKPHQTTKKIFSNWGGEFFKKNLDFRANTNKILEKMQLNKAPVAAGVDVGGGGGGTVNSEFSGGSGGGGGGASNGSSAMNAP